jgi:dihydrofolate reductase
VLEGALTDEARRPRPLRDVIVAGSTSVVHKLIEHDLVDEYRLLVFPTVLGGGRRLTPDATAPLDLRLASAEQVGAAALPRYERR